VTIRLRLRGPAISPELSTPADVSADAPRSVIMYGIEEPVKVCARDSLGIDDVLQGPALITETVSTTWLAPGWQAIRHESGGLLLKRLEQ